MTNEESYRMMMALRQHLVLQVIQNKHQLEVILKFKTVDGKLHQIANSHKERE
jgi:protein-arginine kinase